MEESSHPCRVEIRGCRPIPEWEALGCLLNHPVAVDRGQAVIRSRHPAAEVNPAAGFLLLRLPVEGSASRAAALRPEAPGSLRRG